VTINANDVKILNLTLAFMGEIRVNGDRIQIMGNNITTSSTSTGLTVSGSSCNITNNNLNGRISLESSSNALRQNRFYSLFFQFADGNIVDSNEMGYFRLDNSQNNVVFNNHVSTEILDCALDVHNSSNNVFYGNQIKVDLWNVDLRLSQSENNTFYHNSFFGDDGLVTIGTDCSNSWDNGKEGNYWQNYAGSDIIPDGIGDTPYFIDANNIDRYPLMSPWSGNSSQFGFFSLQDLLIVFAAVLLALVVVLALYFRRISHDERKLPTLSSKKQPVFEFFRFPNKRLHT
jgi:hypothetical protein